MSGSSDDPCLRCRLPDCDDADSGCELRRLRNSLRGKRRTGRHGEITDAERGGYNAVASYWQIERLAEASEGTRPYRRAGSPWLPGGPAPIVEANPC